MSNNNNEQPKKCLYPNCTKVAGTRGLCNTHYGNAARFVREGRTTWAALETAGKATPSRNAKSWFLS